MSTLLMPETEPRRSDPFAANDMAGAPSDGVTPSSASQTYANGSPAALRIAMTETGQGNGNRPARRHRDGTGDREVREHGAGARPACSRAERDLRPARRARRVRCGASGRSQGRLESHGTRPGDRRGGGIGSGRPGLNALASKTAPPEA